MVNNPLIFILVLVAVVCFLIYYDLRSKYKKLEDSFGGFMNRSLVRFEIEKSPLHSIVYGATGTGKPFLLNNI